MDDVPVIEERRVARAILCHFLALGISNRTSAHKSGFIHRKRSSEKWNALINQASTPDFLRSHGNMASHRSLRPHTERKARSMGGTQCDHWLCWLRHLLPVVHVAVDTAQWGHGGVV